MNAAEIIRPYLIEANRRRPELAIINTTETAGELLQLTLALAGDEWAFVGKTEGMDGAYWRPRDFTPFEVELTDRMGVTRRIRIKGVSQDAAWHLPTRRQVKVIAFSAANDPGPWDHGPAKLTPYEIEEQNYRWHNPPVPQFGTVATPIPPPRPPDPPAAIPVIPGREEMRDEAEFLDRFYAAPEGLQRPQGLSINGRPDWEGVMAWLFDVYLHARVSGKDRKQARAAYVRQIQQSQEWRDKHPGGAP